MLTKILLLCVALWLVYMALFVIPVTHLLWPIVYIYAFGILGYSIAGIKHHVHD